MKFLTLQILTVTLSVIFLLVSGRRLTVDGEVPSSCTVWKEEEGRSCSSFERRQKKKSTKIVKDTGGGGEEKEALSRWLFSTQ